jgi:hypothetical protein
MSSMILTVHHHDRDGDRDEPRVEVIATERDLSLRCLLGDDQRWPECCCPVHRPDLHRA